VRLQPNNQVKILAAVTTYFAVVRYFQKAGQQTRNCRAAECFAHRANRSVITEKLLSIIGEDVQEINRKNKPFWSGILRCRVLILSNELPDFKDDTGVIATRFIILLTSVSFLGREDNELEGKLRAELSGILEL
jgi:hypothetical protein